LPWLVYGWQTQWTTPNCSLPGWHL
jgi:hypothetical protein